MGGRRMGKGKQIYFTENEITSLLYLLEEWEELLKEKDDPDKKIVWLRQRGAGPAWRKLAEKAQDFPDFSFVYGRNPYKRE